MASRIVIVDLRPILGPLDRIINALDNYDVELDVTLDLAARYVDVPCRA